VSDETPDVFIDYVLSKTFGWTPKQIDEIDDYTIRQYLEIISAEIKEEKRVINKSKLNGF